MFSQQLAGTSKIWRKNYHLVHNNRFTWLNVVTGFGRKFDHSGSCFAACKRNSTMPVLAVDIVVDMNSKMLDQDAHCKIFNNYIPHFLVFIVTV